jgi:hypothetical protein
LLGHLRRVVREIGPLGFGLSNGRGYELRSHDVRRRRNHQRPSQTDLPHTSLHRKFGDQNGRKHCAERRDWAGDGLWD